MPLVTVGFRASCIVPVLKYRLVRECACTDIAYTNVCTSCWTNNYRACPIGPLGETKKWRWAGMINNCRYVFFYGLPIAGMSVAVGARTIMFVMVLASFLGSMFIASCI